MHFSEALTLFVPDSEGVLHERYHCPECYRLAHLAPASARYPAPQQAAPDGASAPAVPHGPAHDGPLVPPAWYASLMGGH